MAWLWWTLAGFLALVLVAGVTVTVADARGWIKSPALRRFLRRAYGRDQGKDQ